MKLLQFLFSFSAVLCYSIVKSMYTHKMMTEITTLDDIIPVVTGQIDQLALTIYLHEDCENCHKMEPIITEFTEKFENMISVYVVDCQIIWNDESQHEYFPMCQPKHLIQLPALVAYEPPKTKINPYTKEMNRPQERQYQGPVSVKDLSAWAVPLMPAYRQLISNYEQFTEFALDKNFPAKVILFTNKKETSPLYKAITAKYNERLLFGEVREEIAGINEQFHIKSYPSLHVLSEKDGNLQQADYQGKLKMNAISEFLDQFASKERIKVEPKPGSQSSSSDSGKKEKQQKQRAPQVDELKIKKYAKLILTSEKPYLIHVYENNDHHPHFENLTMTLQNMFQYLYLDVSDPENMEFAKNNMFLKSFPSIKYLPPESHKKEQFKLSFGNQVDQEYILQELNEFISDNSVSLNDQQLQIQMQATLATPKILLLLFHEKETPNLSFRMCTHIKRFQEKFNFANIKKPSAALQQQFGIQKLPTLVMLYRELPSNKTYEDPIDNTEIKVGHFPGRIKYDELEAMMEQILQQDEGKSSKKVREIQNQDDFAKICQNKQTCFIAIMDGKERYKPDFDDEEYRLKNQLETLEKVKDKYGNKPIQISWIDGICHSEILQSFNLIEEDLPNFISFNKDNQYGRMIGRLDSESLGKHIDNTLRKRTQLQNLNLEDFIIEDKDCEEVHKQIEERKNKASQGAEEEEDEILREILEEERKKREALEEELGLNDKKKKKKKKRSKKDDL